MQAESLLGWAQMLHEDYDDALATFSKVLMKEPANSLARINVGYICLKKRIFGEAIEHLSKAIRLDNDRKATLYAHYYLGLVYLEREMYEDAQTFFQKTLELGPNLIEAYYELGRASGSWRTRRQRRARGKTASRPTSSIPGANAVRKCWTSSPPEESRRVPPRPDVLLLQGGDSLAHAVVGRVRVVAPEQQLGLAIGLAESVDRPSNWPGLGRRSPPPFPLILARDSMTLARIAGGRAPGWGAGIALPSTRAIVLRSDLGGIEQTLRHEVAHLVLHDAVRASVPLWFDEGYAAVASGELDRMIALRLNLAVVGGRVPTLNELDRDLRGSARTADAAYGLAASAVAEIARLQPAGGLERMFGHLAEGQDSRTVWKPPPGARADRFELDWQRTSGDATVSSLAPRRRDLGCGGGAAGSAPVAQTAAGSSPPARPGSGLGASPRKSPSRRLTRWIGYLKLNPHAKFRLRLPSVTCDSEPEMSSYWGPRSSLW